VISVHHWFKKCMWSPNTILEGGHPRIIPQKFGCNWPSGFWGEDFYVYELWNFAYFDRLCKLEKRGDEILKKIFSSETTEPISPKLNRAVLAIWRNSLFSNGGHLGYRTALTDTFLKGDHLRQRSPVSKMAAITKIRFFFQMAKTALF
jgi:hypothetical protein